MNSEPTVNFGIIGCGRIGKRHAEHAATLGNLVAVCDCDKHKADELAKAYGALSFAAADEFLKTAQVDVVAICTPNGYHASQTIAALRAGFHVLCEKPMAITAYDCGEMIKEAERSNKRLFIVKQNRFNPAVEAVKKLIDEGALGKIYSLQLNCFWNRNLNYYENSDWKGTKALDGGTLFTQFSHFIDLLYWMIGDVKKVSAMMSNFNHRDSIEFEDTGVVSLEFQNGTLGAINYTVNAFSKNMEGSLTLFAEKGTVKIGGQYLNKLEYQDIDGVRITDLKPGNPANEYGEYQGSMSNHDKVYENVIEVLKNGGAIATNGFEGLKTVEIIERIYQQAHEQ